MTSTAANAAIAILLISVIPKISINKGIKAEDGVDLKKSIKNSTLLYAGTELPSSTPSGTPMRNAMRKA
jgi:hypothetical protein